MVYTIDEIKYIVIPIAKRYGIASISLFGFNWDKIFFITFRFRRCF